MNLIALLILSNIVVCVALHLALPAQSTKNRVFVYCALSCILLNLFLVFAAPTILGFTPYKDVLNPDTATLLGEIIGYSIAGLGLGYYPSNALLGKKFIETEGKGTFKE